MHIEKKYLKFIQSLVQKKQRQQNKQFVLEGAKLIQEALDNNVSFDYVVYNKDLVKKRGYESLIVALRDAGIKIMWGHESEIQKISNFTTSDGLLAVAHMAEYKKSINSSLVLVFEGINDPGNLGTIIRTADWFGISDIVLGEGSVDMYNPKVVRATMGSLFRVRIHPHVNIEEFLSQQQNSYTIWGTSLQGDDFTDDVINKFQDTSPKVIVFGNESHGLSENVEKMCEHLIKIIGVGQAESLNLALSAGILMYEGTKNLSK